MEGFILAILIGLSLIFVVYTIISLLFPKRFFEHPTDRPPKSQNDDEPKVSPNNTKVESSEYVIPKVVDYDDDVVTLVKDGKVELDKQGKPQCDGSLGDAEGIPLIEINNPEDKIKEIHEKIINMGIEKLVDFEKTGANLSKWFKEQEEKEILNNEITTLLNESNIDIPKPEKTTEEQIENYRNEGWIPMSESNENEDISDFRIINGEDWVKRKP
jgi:hypothetical protein